MIRYKKFQFGWFMVVLFVLAMVLITIGYTNKWGNNAMDVFGYVLLMALFSFILLTFYGLMVTVDDKYIKIRFGIGLFKKRIDLSTVVSAEIITYPLITGYGIRLLPNGILYNVSGRYAVELKLKEKQRSIMIGTNDQENLKSIIENRLKEKPWEAR